ncbi:MAG: hypothetical protein ACOC6F_00875 [bacterium]
MLTKVFVKVTVALGLIVGVSVAIAVIVRFLVFPSLPPDWRSGSTWIGTTAVGSLIVLAAIADATGYSFKDLFDAEDQPPSFSISSSAISLSDGGIKLTDGTFTLDPNLVLSIRTKMCVHNPASPVSIRLRVASVAPAALLGCLPAELALGDVNVRVRHRKQPNWAAVELGNPFVAEAGDLHIEVGARIPLVVSRIEEAFGALAMLRSMDVALEATMEGTGDKLGVPAMSLDLSPVHARIESDVERQIPKYPVRSNQPVDTKALLSAMKRYWTGPGEGNAS